MPPIELARYRYSKNHPFAPPDRRFRIAKVCRDQGVNPSFRRDDKATWRLWRFLKNRAATFEPDQRARFLMDNQDLSIAFQLHHGARRSLRPAIEAYLVAGADDASIAEKLAVPTAAIRWFRLAFYDIEHLRNAPLRIVQQLIGITAEDGHCALDTPAIWKLIGYKLKSAGLDALFFASRDDGEAFQVGGLAAWLSRQTQAVLAVKRFAATNGLNTDDPKHVEVLLKLLSREPRRQPESEEARTTVLERHISAMLTEIPWTSGALAEEVYKDTAVGAWDERSVELPDEELLLLAAGEEVPGLDEVENLDVLLKDNGYQRKDVEQ